jgi:hypothetical protein
MMNTMFGEWYRAASLDPKNGELELRWQGVEKHKATKDLSFMTDIVRLFLENTGPSEDFLAQFRQPFFDADNSGFRMTGNDAELRVLAGTVILEVLSRKDVFSDNMALVTIACAAPEFRKKAPIIKDALPAVTKYLFDRANIVRQVTMKQKTTLGAIDAELTEMTQLAASNPAGAWKPAEAAIRRVAENVSRVSEHLEARITAVQRRQDVLSEESNIVWWLFGGADRATSQSYGEKTPVDAVMSCANDLATLTNILPPPLAAPAYIARCLATQADTSATLDEIASAEWGIQVGQSSLLPLTSLHLAIHQGTPAKTALKAVVASFSLKTGRFSVRDLAFQLYREILVLRILQAKAA